MVNLVNAPGGGNTPRLPAAWILSHLRWPRKHPLQWLWLLPSGSDQFLTAESPARRRIMGGNPDR